MFTNDEVVTCHHCDEAKEEVQHLPVQAETEKSGQKVNMRHRRSLIGASSVIATVSD